MERMLVFHNVLEMSEAYFHEDFDLAYGSGEGTAWEVRRVWGEYLPSLIAEVDEILASPRTDTELQELWIEELGSYYEPDQDGMTYRQWFEKLRAILTSPLPKEAQAE